MDDFKNRDVFLAVVTTIIFTFMFWIIGYGVVDMAGIRIEMKVVNLPIDIEYIITGFIAVAIVTIYIAIMLFIAEELRGKRW